jgi:hypothetical protein
MQTFAGHRQQVAVVDSAKLTLDHISRLDSLLLNWLALLL